LKLRLRAAAVRDIDDIYDYGVVTHGAAAAERYTRMLDGAMQRLLEHPKLGPARDFAPGLRSLSAEQHRIFYTIEMGKIVVVRVLHMSMDVRRHL
jgi:toxin ParE1/3/4